MELQRLEEAGQLKKAYELAEEILAADSHEIHAMRTAARLAVRLGDMRRAYALAEDYHFFRPADTSMLYLYSFLARKHGEFELATELGERVRLRSPALKQNLWNLIRAYVARRNVNRAAQLLDEFLEHYPGHTRALELKQSILQKAGNA
jgi:tetratricopeptide (TPR) repeat protein